MLRYFTPFAHGSPPPPKQGEDKKRKEPPSTAEEDYAHYKKAHKDHLRPTPMEAHSAAKRAIAKWAAMDAENTQKVTSMQQELNKDMARLRSEEIRMEKDASGN